MDDKKQIQISLSILFLIIAIIIIVIMAYFIHVILNKKNISENQNINLTAKVNSLENTLSSMKVESKNEINNATNNSENINNSNTLIPIEDLFGIDYNAFTNKNNTGIAKISDGNLYYLDTAKIDRIAYIAPCNEYYTKLDSDVKRIKSVTLGSDTSIDYLVIKNDGSVKLLISTNPQSYEIYDELKDYKVDDITNFDGETFTLKLLDGTTQKVKHFTGGA